MHTPTHLPTRAELRALIAGRSQAADAPADASGVYAAEDRRSVRGVLALRHYVVAWDTKELPSALPALADLEERVLRISSTAQLDEELPAGCTVAGAIVDASGELDRAYELMAATRRRWPGVPLMLRGARIGALEQRALVANGITCAESTGAAPEAALRAFVMRGIAQRLAQCQRFETRMAHWGLSEKEAQMIVLLALGLSETALPSALETTQRYVATMRRSIVEKTAARDVFGVLARLTGGPL